MSSRGSVNAEEEDDDEERHPLIQQEKMVELHKILFVCVCVFFLLVCVPTMKLVLDFKSSIEPRGGQSGETIPSMEGWCAITFFH